MTHSVSEEEQNVFNLEFKESVCSLSTSLHHWFIIKCQDMFLHCIKLTPRLRAGGCLKGTQGNLGGAFSCLESSQTCKGLPLTLRLSSTWLVTIHENRLNWSAVVSHFSTAETHLWWLLKIKFRFPDITHVLRRWPWICISISMTHILRITATEFLKLAWPPTHAEPLVHKEQLHLQLKLAQKCR